MEKDQYKTIAKPCTGLYKEKGSKFLAFAYNVETEEQIQTILKEIHKTYHDARHHSYAYILGADKSKYRANDDGEPTNSAGKPILGQINAFDLTNMLVIVVRYFGGVLLGVGGLMNAYKSAAFDALCHAEICIKTLTCGFKITFNYLDMNTVMRIIKEENITIKNTIYEQSTTLTLEIRKKSFERVKDRLGTLSACTIVE